MPCRYLNNKIIQHSFFHFHIGLLYRCHYAVLYVLAASNLVFHFDSCPEKKLINNCLDIDHSCSHLPSVNPAIFQGVMFNNFGSGLIYDSKKKKSTKCHFQTSFVLSYALCQYIVRLSATQKENANYPPYSLT